MHKILTELAEMVGQEWARRWLDHLQASQNASMAQTPGSEDLPRNLAKSEGSQGEEDNDQPKER